MSAARRKGKSRRNNQLAAIHVCSSQLGLDREAYEAVLQRVTGKTSSADMDDDERHAVLQELRRLGAPQPARRTSRGRAKPGQYPGRPQNIDREPMLTKVEQLLAEMGAAWSYADAIARQMFGIERVAWLKKPSQFRAIIAALDARHRKLQAIAEQEQR